MESSDRRGQTLIEVLIFMFFVLSFFVFLEVSHEKFYKHYEHYKVKKQTF